MDKMARSAAYTRGKFISPAIRVAGSDAVRQVQEEFLFIKRWVLVTGTLVTRAKRAGRPCPESPVDLPLARVEAAGNNRRVGGVNQPDQSWYDRLGNNDHETP